MPPTYIELSFMVYNISTDSYELCPRADGTRHNVSQDASHFLR